MTSPGSWQRSMDTKGVGRSAERSWRTCTRRPKKERQGGRMGSTTGSAGSWKPSMERVAILPLQRSINDALIMLPMQVSLYQLQTEEPCRLPSSLGTSACRVPVSETRPRPPRRREMGEPEDS
ncbi:unnamed protein product [Musa textilis]